MGKILFAGQDGIQILKFLGDIRVSLGPSIAGFLNLISKRDGVTGVVIDLRETTGIDSTSLGLLAKISLRSQEQLQLLPTLVSNNEDITRVLTSMGFEKIFCIVDDTTLDCKNLDEMLPQSVCENTMRSQVIEAHRALMNLNEGNLVAFKDLVDALQHEHAAATRSLEAQASAIVDAKRVDDPADNISLNRANGRR